MDIVSGSTDGRDAVRSFLRAGDTIADDEIQQAWDTAVDATQRWIRPGYATDAPAGVVEFVTNVAAVIWQARDTRNEVQSFAEGQFTTGPSITSNLVRRYAVLGGPYVITPRVIA